MALTTKLKKQLESKSVEIRQYAQDCLTIANKLKELNNGHIWSSQWNALTKIRMIDGVAINVPTEIGEIFLNNLK